MTSNISMILHNLTAMETFFMSLETFAMHPFRLWLCCLSSELRCETIDFYLWMEHKPPFLVSRLAEKQTCNKTSCRKSVDQCQKIDGRRQMEMP